MRNVAWAVNVAAQAMLFVAVLRMRCWPRFIWWLAASIASAVLLSRFDPRSPSYLFAYAACEPLLMFLLTAALVELLASRSARFAFGVGRTWYVLAAVALVAATALGFAVSHPAWRRPLLLALWMARQWFTAGYAIAAVGSLALLGAFRVETAGAVLMHHRFLAAYASIQAVGSLAVRYRVQDANTIALAAGAGLFLAWACCTRPLEQLPPPVRGPMADQLDREQSALADLVAWARNLIRRA